MLVDTHSTHVHRDCIPHADGEECLPMRTAPAPVPTMPRQALTSSASADWGTPETVRRFAACVLRPAARSDQAIDVDAMSSSYWQAQWAPGDRPRECFDGTKGRDVFFVEDWDAMTLRCAGIGSAFCNPAGDASGTVIQNAWYALNDLHRAKKIGSFFWVGFNLEQLRSLIPEGDEVARDALHPLDARVMTVLPSKRISYMVHPEAMIKLVEAKLAKRPAVAVDGETRRLRQQLDTLRARSDDSPVVGGAPTHASYLTIVWHHDASTRRRQQRAAKDFLKAQRDLPKSALVRAMSIGDVG